MFLYFVPHTSGRFPKYSFHISRNSTPKRNKNQFIFLVPLVSWRFVFLYILHRHHTSGHRLSTTRSISDSLSDLRTVHRRVQPSVLNPYTLRSGPTSLHRPFRRSESRILRLSTFVSHPGPEKKVGSELPTPVSVGSELNLDQDKWTSRNNPEVRGSSDGTIWLITRHLPKIIFLVYGKNYFVHKQICEIYITH